VGIETPILIEAPAAVDGSAAVDVSVAAAAGSSVAAAADWAGAADAAPVLAAGAAEFPLLQAAVASAITTDIASVSILFILSPFLLLGILTRVLYTRIQAFVELTGIDTVDIARF
jgi:hypothetical protein